METRANYVIVGIFTLVAIVAAFAFVYWTAAIGDRGETAMLRVRIPGSASGLGRGSAVLFNGVKVGDVRRVYIDVNNPTVAIADTEIDRLTPITKSTQADIGIAGLTGQANIELKGADLDGSPICSTRRSGTAGSPRSPPTRRRSPICCRPRRTSSRAPTRCCPTRRLRHRRARTADRYGQERPEILGRAGDECRRHRQIPGERHHAVRRTGRRLRQARRHAQGRRRADQVGRHRKIADHRRQCRDIHQESERDRATSSTRSSAASDGR